MDFRERMHKAKEQGQQGIEMEAEETRKLEARFPALKLQLLAILKEYAQTGGYEFFSAEREPASIWEDTYGLRTIQKIGDYKDIVLSIKVARERFSWKHPSKKRIQFESKWSRQKSGTGWYDEGFMVTDDYLRTISEEELIMRIRARFEEAMLAYALEYPDR